MTFVLIFIGACNLGWIGDWYCDDENNNMECDYDGGDCCGPYVDTTYCDKCLCLNDTITQAPTIYNITIISMFIQFLNFLLICMVI